MAEVEGLNVCSMMMDESCLDESFIYNDKRTSQELQSYSDFCKETVQTLTSLIHALSNNSSHTQHDFLGISQFIDHSHVSAVKNQYNSIKRSRSYQKITDSPGKKRAKLDQTLCTKQSNTHYSAQLECIDDIQLSSLIEIFNDRLTMLNTNRSATNEIHQFFTETIPSLCKSLGNSQLIFQLIILINKCIKMIGKDSFVLVINLEIIFQEYHSLLVKQMKALNAFLNSKGSFNLMMEFYGKFVTMFSPLLSLMELFKPAVKYQHLQPIYRDIYQNFIILSFNMAYNAKEIHAKSKLSSYALSSFCSAFIQSVISSLLIS